MTEAPPPTDLATLRGEVMTALAELRGDVRLVLQTTEHGQRRIDDVARQVEHLDSRADAIEAERATRAEVEKARADAKAEVDAAKAELKDEANKRTQRNLALAGIAVTATGIICSTGTAIITSTLTK